MPRGQEVDQLYWTLGTNLAPLNTGIGQATGKLQKLTAFIKSPIGAIATLGAVAALTGAKARRMASELDSALREVSTLLPKTVEEMEGLRDAVVALSTEVPEPPVQLTKGLYQVISAGITDTAAALHVLETASKAATAGLSDTFTAVDAITTVLNGYQLSADQASRVSDVFFATIAEGKINFSQLASGIGDVATTAALAGVTIEELGATIATMTKFGIASQEAMTALNRLFLVLVEDGDEARAVSKALGIEFNLAAVQTKGFTGVMNELYAATGGNIEQLFELVPEIRAFKSAVIVAGQGNAEFNRILQTTTNSAEAATVAFNKMLYATDNLEAMIKNRLAAGFYKLGAPIDYVYGKFLSLILLLSGGLPQEQTFIEGLSKLSDEQLVNRIADTGAELANLQQKLKDLEATSFWQKPLTDDERWRPRVIDETREAIEKLKGELEFLNAASDRRVTLWSESEERKKQEVYDKQTEAIRKLGEGLVELTRPMHEVDAATQMTEDRLRQMNERLREMRQEAENARLALDDLQDVMEGQRIEDANAKVEGLVAAWAKMPRSAETTIVMLATIRKVLGESGTSTDALTESLRAYIKMMEDSLAPEDRHKAAMMETRDAVISLSRSLIDAARAFGVFGDTAAANLGSVANIAQQVSALQEGWGTMGVAAKFAGVGGIVASVAGILGSVLGGGGPSLADETERKRLEILRQNNEALQRLTTVMSEQLTGVRFGQAAGFQGAVSEAQRRWAEAMEEARQNWDYGDPDPFIDFMALLREEMERAGLSIEQITELAKQLGYELDESAQGFADFAEWLKKVDLAKAFETYAGKMARLRQEFDLFDISDPMEQLRRILSVFDEFTDFEMPTDMTARALREWVQNLFTNLPSLGAQFGSLTADEISDLLSTLNSLIDDVADGTAEGVTKGFQVSRSITEVTGNRIAGIMTTVAYWSERSAMALDALVAGLVIPPVLPPTQDEMATFIGRGNYMNSATAGEGPMTVTVTVGDIVVQAAGDAVATAQAVADRLAENLDRALGERLRDVRRARGLPMPDGLRS